MMDGAAIPKSLLRRELLAEPAHFRPDDDGRNTPLLFTPLRLGDGMVLGGGVVCSFSATELFLIISACASRSIRAD